MNVFKGMVLGLLCFLLFLSLSVFGLAFTVDRTVLNPGFFAGELDKLDITAIIEEIASEPMTLEDFPPELKTALFSSISRLEPLIKEEVSATVSHVYDYLLGKNESPDLSQVLRTTFFNSEFITSLIEELDLASLTEEIINEATLAEDFPDEFKIALVNTVTKLAPLIKEEVIAATDPIFPYLLAESQHLDLAGILRSVILDSGFVISLVDELDVSFLASTFFNEQLITQIPIETEFLTEYLDDAIDTLEPVIKNELKEAAAPLTEYLLGERHSLYIVISLESVLADLEGPLRIVFQASLPAEYAGLPPSQLNQLFAEFFTQLTEIIPDSLVIDESLLGTEVPAQIAEAVTAGNSALQQVRQDITETLTKIEQQLAEIKPYVGYFQLGYKLLIVFIALLILAIILINRQVKITSRLLGIVLATSGALELANIFIVKSLGRNQLLKYDIDIPQAVQGLPEQLLSNLLSPLLWLSIGFLIAGATLITVSIIYKSRQASS